MLSVPAAVVSFHFAIILCRSGLAGVAGEICLASLMADICSVLAERAAPSGKWAKGESLAKESESDFIIFIECSGDCKRMLPLPIVQSRDHQTTKYQHVIALAVLDNV